MKCDSQSSETSKIPISDDQANFYHFILSSTIGINEVDLLSNEAMKNVEIFEFIFDLIFSEDIKTAWHAAWVIEKVSEKSIDLFDKSHNSRLIELILTSNHGGLRRLSLSILFNLPLIKPISVDFINRCFEQMMSVKEPVAVQVLSMKILEKICKVEPDLKQELIASLMSLDVELYSKGFIAARKNIIKRLEMSS